MAGGAVVVGASVVGASVVGASDVEVVTSDVEVTTELVDTAVVSVPPFNDVDDEQAAANTVIATNPTTRPAAVFRIAPV